VNDDLRALYGWVRGSRERVFRWTESLPRDVYALECPDFAYGSIRNIHAHVVDCYQVWVAARLLGGPRPPDTAAGDVAAMRAAFSAVDDAMECAFSTVGDLDAPVVIDLPDWDPLTVTGRWLLMHPITHEFHHKGQMLALGRVLGHPYPAGPDTDLMEPFGTP